MGDRRIRYSLLEEGRVDGGLNERRSGMMCVVLGLVTKMLYVNSGDEKTFTELCKGTVKGSVLRNSYVFVSVSGLTGRERVERST